MKGYMPLLGRWNQDDKIHNFIIEILIVVIL